MGVQKAIVCGGGSLAPHLEDFFESMGLPVINGWGLTETSPVIACRAMETDDEPQHNVRGTVGRPLPGTTVKCGFWRALYAYMGRKLLSFCGAPFSTLCLSKTLLCGLNVNYTYIPSEVFS